MRALSFLLVLWVPMLLAACAGGGPSSAPLPRYGVGDTYRFDDGTARRVASSDADTVLWQLNGRDSLVTTRDVLMPPLVERTPGSVVQHRLEGEPDLFPLVPGKQVAFSTITERHTRGHRHPSRSDQYWRCGVGNDDPVHTPAGEFDTIRVDCVVRQSDSAPALHRTYFYAPSIGFYVRREDQLGDGPVRSVSLAAYSLGNPTLADSALRRRIGAIQQALERHVSDDPVTWRDPASNTSGSVDPLLTVRSQRYGWCREFREQMRAAERHYDLTGTACRDQTGTWQVREVTPFSTASR